MQGSFKVFLIILTLVALLGCGTDGSGESSGTITIYSGRSETLISPLIDRFTKATGVEASVKYAKTPQLAATLLEEGRNSPADVFFAQDPGGLAAVDHLLVPLPSTILDRVPAWAVSATGRWVGLSGRARTVVYNTDNLESAELPDDISGFIDPQWKGRIGWAPTNASFQTMITAMRSVWGEAKTRQWLEGIQANDPKVYPKNTPIVAAVGAGEIDAGFVNHYYLHRFLAEEGDGFPARNYHPKAGGPGATIMVAGAGILEQSTNQDAAERFLEFLLSPEAQEYFARKTFEYPLSQDVEQSPGLAPLTDLNHPGLTAAQLSDIKGTQDILRQTGLLP